MGKIVSPFSGSCYGMGRLCTVSEAVVNDEYFMRRALRLARRGEGRVSPNPLVGAVFVRDGRIIGEGWHRCCGENHAEINALEAAREDVAGATLYVTLEPCSHYGRTPPCAERLVSVRPARVVMGTLDPNPLVAGRGRELLKQHGIATTVGVLETACRRLNAPFFKYITTGIPYVTVKFAQSIDGRIATKTGSSRWISSPPSLRFAHELRRAHDAVLVGVGTVLADDPELTVRLVKGRSPLRLVVDSRLRLSPEAKVVTDGKAPTMVVTTPDAPEGMRGALMARGIEVLTVAAAPDGQVDLKALLAVLGKRGITSLLVEGGSAVLTTVIKERLADRLIIVVAPKLVGDGLPPVGDLGIVTMDEALHFPQAVVRRRGVDTIYDIRTHWNGAD
ncbi:MAG: bifunctional diaminohydroxyphosphoribosylaminopyrimidine deaminase/5-amino-6-(5-phosphoribosylamino)uracil reductase RibD [Syntrophales bacterium]|nr:bifunctional diaminohydroxyphosphoribosylaminopyrimidine deaminase/5-amino-6-(5-phosphoribosylamino)uracil reductase RibD [Syntrophales bacterium]